MQTLWTRVAQVRASCRCPQCVSSTSAVAHRAAATATRRAPRFWTSSTIWYSGIFAVAATLDLGVKQQRRQQWNQAIADVKQELATSDADANRGFLDSLEEETVASGAMRDNLDSSILRTDTPEWPVSMGQERLVQKLPPQSIYADVRMKAKHMVDRWHPKKLERVQLSIDALQLEFFEELHRQGWHEEAASAVPAWYAEHILQPVETIREVANKKQQDLRDLFSLKGKYRHEYDGNGVEDHGVEEDQTGFARFARWQRSEGDVPLCNYGQDELGQFHNTAHDLNAALQKLFDMGRDLTLSKPAVLAKVYHNLSVSSAPPNIDTFNTLLIGLSDIGTRRLIEGCIHSLQCAKLRHNEVTLASILNYWTLTGNQEEFQYWVQLMRGEWGGLALAQPHVQITESSQGRLFKTNEKTVKIRQRPSPTPMVFSALIKGVLKFSGFDAALGVCEAARGEGWGLCINGLYPLLKDCSRRRDWPAGLATWTQIQALRSTRAKQFEQGTWKIPAIGLPTFASMLQLCIRCNNRTAFQDVMEQAVIAHPDSAVDLIRMVRAERSEMQTSDQEVKSAAGDLKPTSDISNWLEKQNVYKHCPQLKGMRWQDIVTLDARRLMGLNEALTHSARDKLLKVFRKVRDTHPVYDNSWNRWLAMRDDRLFRIGRVLRKRNPISITLDRDESQELDQMEEYKSRVQPAQEDYYAQPLPVLDEVDQHASHALGMAAITDQLPSAYQPFGQ